MSEVTLFGDFKPQEIQLTIFSCNLHKLVWDLFVIIKPFGKIRFGEDFRFISVCFFQNVIRHFIQGFLNSRYTYCIEAVCQKLKILYFYLFIFYYRIKVKQKTFLYSGLLCGCGREVTATNLGSLVAAAGRGSPSSLCQSGSSWCCQCIPETLQN